MRHENPEPYGLGVFLCMARSHSYAVFAAGALMSIRLAVTIVFSVIGWSAAAEIYKTVDANGNVVFTDIAPIERSGQAPAQEVNVPPINSYEPPPSAQSPNGSAPASSVPSYYSDLEVISPTEDETIRDNAGNVQIQVAISPPLRADHRLLLVLDGTPTDVEAVNGVFELSNVDRGIHTAGARAVDRQGNVLIESNPATFNLMRVSIDGPTPMPHAAQ